MTAFPRATRREFLRQTAAFSLLGAGAPMAFDLAGIAQAATTAGSNYKALICIFLTGGNDAYNTVLATDAASWSAYRHERDQESGSIALNAAGTPAVRSATAALADRLGGVLPITPRRTQGRSFALHPSLGGLRPLFNAGRLAVVANVGPLIQPTTKPALLSRAVPRPLRLYSHNDQQSVWQSMGVEGRTHGWGGRIAERFLAANGGSMFTSVSVAGASVFANGQNLLPYQLPTGGLQVGGGDALFGSAAAQQRLLAVMRNRRVDHPLFADHTAISRRATDAAEVLGGLLPARRLAPWGTPDIADPKADPLFDCADPDTGEVSANPLAVRLQAVLRMIAARGALGVKRQVFFVTLDGFDVHDDLMGRHALLLARLSHGLRYLDRALAAMGVADQVTAFTASEFGRAFASNGDGCDHGWGGHHLVLGGAVRGGDVYGRFPEYSVSDGRGGFSSDDQLEGGVLLPRQSVDQYGATLARWFGVGDAGLADVFPNLANFPTRDLGFMA